MKFLLDGPQISPDEGQAVEKLVVFLHGYGADGHDLIGLAPEFKKYLSNCHFFSPHAPEACTANPMGRQWFALQAFTPDELWQGVMGAQAELEMTIDAKLKELSLTPSDMALVGFSQGTMMALHQAARAQTAYGAVVGFSGVLAGPEFLAKDMISMPPYLLIHGDQDPVVPVEASRMAHRFLKAADCEVELMTCLGLQHGISPEGIDRAGKFLAHHLGAPSE